VLLKRGKNDGIAVYIPKETILKKMVAKIKLSQHFFTYFGNFPIHLVFSTAHCALIIWNRLKTFVAIFISLHCYFLLQNC
jgi:hypothetical protein